MGKRSGYGMDKGRWDSSLEEFVYEAISERITLPKAEFIEQLKEWELKPIEMDGNLAAVVMVKGNEVHVASSKEYRGKWLSRRVIRRTLGEILNDYDQALTSVSYGNTSGREFVERLGFVPDSVTYILEKLKHA